MLWHSAQSCHDDRPTSSVTPVRQVHVCVGVFMSSSVVHAEGGDKELVGWGGWEKQSLEAYSPAPFVLIVFSLCSESTGHDHDHRRLGLAHLSITWGKNKTYTAIPFHTAAEHRRILELQSDARTLETTDVTWKSSDDQTEAPVAEVFPFSSHLNTWEALFKYEGYMKLWHNNML